VRSCGILSCASDNVMYRISGRSGQSGSTRATGLSPGVHAVTTRDFLLDKVSLGDPTSWLYVAAFIWPAAFLLHARKRPAARLTKALWFIEPLLLAGPLYVIAMFSILRDYDVGSYVGWAGLAVYFFAGSVRRWTSGVSGSAGPRSKPHEPNMPTTRSSRRHRFAVPSLAGASERGTAS